MDRVPYRRVKPSRLSEVAGVNPGFRHAGDRRNIRDFSARRDFNENEEPTTQENVILQCIISGILVVIVLLVSLVNIAPAVAVRDGLRNALSGPTTVQELFYDARAFAEDVLGPSPETEPEAFPDYPFYGLSEPISPYILTPPDLSAIPVLEHENTLTEAVEVLNPQIPGPSVTPGLWD